MLLTENFSSKYQLSKYHWQISGLSKYHWQISGLSKYQLIIATSQPIRIQNCTQVNDNAFYTIFWDWSYLLSLIFTRIQSQFPNLHL